MNQPRLKTLIISSEALGLLPHKVEYAALKWREGEMERKALH